MSPIMIPDREKVLQAMADDIRNYFKNYLDYRLDVEAQWNAIMIDFDLGNIYHDANVVICNAIFKAFDEVTSVIFRKSKIEARNFLHSIYDIEGEMFTFSIIFNAGSKEFLKEIPLYRGNASQTVLGMLEILIDYIMDYLSILKIQSIG